MSEQWTFLTFISLLCWFLLGFGVERLRDNIMDTYWQSDGQLPHLVNIQFHRKTNISQIYIYTDYKLDESYTPSRISIRAGSHFNDLQELQIVDLNEPTGKYKLFHFVMPPSMIYCCLFQVGSPYPSRMAVLSVYAHLCFKSLLYPIIKMVVILICVKYAYMLPSKIVIILWNYLVNLVL